MITIAKISAVVEKLAGRINPNVINTGSHKSKNEDLKDTGSSVFLERNLATKIINITKAKVDV
jgi:hypothetical protein